MKNNTTYEIPGLTIEDKPAIKKKPEYDPTGPTYDLEDTPKIFSPSALVSADSPPYFPPADDPKNQIAIYTDLEWSQIVYARALIRGYKNNGHKGDSGYREDYEEGQKILDDVNNGHYNPGSKYNLTPEADMGLPSSLGI
jgi:hypothetical protein